METIISFFSYHPLTTFWGDMAIFFFGFVAYAKLQPAIKNKEWRKVIPWVPLITHAGIIDVLFNQSFGRLMFWELKYTLTLSMRLDLHYKEYGWRGTLSRFISNKLVNKIFPGHITG
jgi:hypothetical protein